MGTLEGKFVIKDQGKLLEFDRCGDLPDEFDHLNQQYHPNLIALLNMSK